MAICTCSGTIAKRTGAAVRLWSRDSFGNVSVNIIMVHVKLGAFGDAIGNQASRLQNSVRIILSISVVLPIALVVAKSVVIFLLDAHGDFDSACDA